MWQGMIRGSTTQTDTNPVFYSLGTSPSPSLGGAFRKAVFYLETTAIGVGDTWAAEVAWAPSSNTARYAAVGQNISITATGMAEITLAVPFSSVNRAIPFPTHVRIANQIAGVSPIITFKVHAAVAG